jgi:GH35 family endo-1,4-beta-xylanase
MDSTEVIHHPENKSHSLAANAVATSTSKLLEDASIMSSRQHQGVFGSAKAITSYDSSSKQNTSDSAHQTNKTNKTVEGQLDMVPLPGFSPAAPPQGTDRQYIARIHQPDPSRPIETSNGSLSFELPTSNSKESAKFLHVYPKPLADGQGEDIHLRLRAEKPGIIKIGLMQPTEPYAQTISEEVQVTRGGQEISLHGIAPTSPDGLLFKMTADPAVGDVKVEGLTVTQSRGPTEPMHYSLVNGQVVEEKNHDVLGKNALGKNVEMRNGQPFIIGFEVQSLNLKDDSQAQQNIQKFLIDNANGATNTPYWNQYEKNPQGFRETAEWLQKHGIEVKEHPALWDQLIPEKNAKGNPIEITPEMIKAHVQEIARLPGQFTEVNETADVNSAPDNAVTRWIKEEGPARATEKAIEWAKQADPGKTVLYNDFQNGAQEMRMLDQMQKDGRLPDAIGIQLHMDQGNWPLSRVEETVNQLAKYGKPIYITEISVLSGDYGESMSQVNHPQLANMAKDFNAIKDGKLSAPDDKVMDTLSRDADSLVNRSFNGDDTTVVRYMLAEAKTLSDPALREKVMKQIDAACTWADTPSGGIAQADYTENLYKLLHSNPHVQGITWWDISDEKSWKHAPRGWFREDGTPKPVVARMEKLFKQWQEELPKS